MSMGLHDEMCKRDRSGSPLRVALVGAGTFGSMFLRQATHAPGVAVVAVVDIDVIRASQALISCGYQRDQVHFTGAPSPSNIVVTDDTNYIVCHADIDVIVEATGSTLAAIRTIRAALAAGKDVVNVTVEADALVGVGLAREAATNGCTYSFAYGDQPALICELVDWARVNGFDVTCAGKGTLYREGFEYTSPDNVWDRYGFSAADADAAGYDRRMFTSFVDGTKSSIEMAAVASATGLGVSDGGLCFPPAGVRDLANVLRPQAQGGLLAEAGCVEVVACTNRDGSSLVEGIRWGVFVVVEAPNDDVARLFGDYGLATDASGRFAALWRPNHLVGLELMTSVASVGLRKVATGCPREHVAEVVAVAKRDLPDNMTIDGEGGYSVYGRLMTAETAALLDAVPIGLARDLKVAQYVSAGDVITWADVEPSPELDVLELRSTFIHSNAGLI